MVKVNKHITIDLEIVEKLNNISNFSDLVERLIRDYIKNNVCNDDKMKQKKAEYKQKKQEINLLKAEIKQIKTISSLEVELKIKNDKETKEKMDLEAQFRDWKPTKEQKTYILEHKMLLFEYFRDKIYKGGKL